MTQNVTIKKINETEIEIAGEVTWADFEKYRKEALAHLGERTELPGFRKGHVPENILREKLGPMAILEEMAERAIREMYPKIIAENKIEAIDRPRVSITKIAEGSPLGFKILQTILPEIALPDYKKIASQTPDVEGAQTSGVERRAKIIENILAQTNIPMPGIIVERQIEEMLADIKKKYGSGTSEAELRATIRPMAVERIRVGLLIETLARAEHIEPSKVLDFLENLS